MATSIECKAHKEGIKYHLKFEYDEHNIDESVFIYKPLEKRGYMASATRNFRTKPKKNLSGKFNRPTRAVTSIGDPQGIMDKNGARRIYLARVKTVIIPSREEKGNWLEVETVEGYKLLFKALYKAKRDKFVTKFQELLSLYQQFGRATRNQLTNVETGGTGIRFAGPQFQQTLGRTRNTRKKKKNGLQPKSSFQDLTMIQKQSSTHADSSFAFDGYQNANPLPRTSPTKRMKSRKEKDRQMMTRLQGQGSNKELEKEDSFIAMDTNIMPPMQPVPSLPGMTVIKYSEKEEKQLKEKEEQRLWGQFGLDGRPPPPPPPSHLDASSMRSDDFRNKVVSIAIHKKDLQREAAGYRNAVMPVLAEAESDAAAQDRTKSKETVAFLEEIFNDSPSLYKAVLEDLDVGATREIVDRMYRVETVEDDKVLLKGKEHKIFYIVEEGYFKQSFSEEGAANAQTVVRGRGGFFGEYTFRFNASSNVTVTSAGKGVLWALSRREYENVLKNSGERLQKLKVSTLTSVDVFKNNLSSSELSSVANALEFKYVASEVTVLDYGQPMFEMIFVTQGEIFVYVSQDGKRVANERPLIKLSKGEYFGEFALFDNVPSNYRLVSASPKTVFLSLNIAEFEALMGPLKQVIEKKFKEKLLHEVTSKEEETRQLQKEQDKQKALAQRQLEAIEKLKLTSAGMKVNPNKLQSLTHIAPKPQMKEEVVEAVEADEEDEDFLDSPALMKGIRFRDLELLTTLGAGNFGKVFLARFNGRNDNQKLLIESAPNNSKTPMPRFGPRHFALKVMSRHYISRNGWEEKVDNETAAMAEVSYFANSNFVLKLYHSFSCPKFVYLLIEYGDGGDLYMLLRSQPQQRFKEPAARFYIASVVNGIDVLHKRKILYRDLKPENLIINRHGHLKVADLGLAKKTRRTYTNCGTPDYTAPEIIKGKGHDHACDWWALGVLVFELHTGTTPFFAESTDQIYENILKHKTPIEFYDEYNNPSNRRKKNKNIGYLKGKQILGSQTKDLIARLLVPKVTMRLGYINSAAQGVRDHPYFHNHRSFSWKSLGDMTIVAPFVPELTEDEDPDHMHRDSSVRVDKALNDRSDWEPRVNSPLTETPRRTLGYQ